MEETRKLMHAKDDAHRQLQLELDESRGLSKELMKQNKDLSERLKEVSPDVINPDLEATFQIRISRDKLFQENQEFKSMANISQTDHLNHRLLMLYREVSTPDRKEESEDVMGSDTIVERMNSQFFLEQENAGRGVDDDTDDW